MQRSSETIGAIAAALAKAQIELTNPEKSQTATIVSPFPREENKTFRYAPLSSGLEIVRKCLGKHEIAAVQTTTIDKDTGLIRLTTTLAHASGEWVASDWPVCPVSETSAPHRLGAALTYARRHSLFTLVGIAGDDDRDAPDLVTHEPHSTPTTSDRAGLPAVASPTNKPAQSVPARATGLPFVSSGFPSQGRRVPPPARPPRLDAEASAAELNRLMAEIGQIDSMDDLAHWAKDALPRKNRLVLADADTLEATFARRLSEVGSTSDASVAEEEAEAVPTDDLASRNVTVDARTRSSDDLSKRKRRRIRASRQTNQSPKIDKSVLAFPEPRRVRDKEHLKFVGRQPCLICGRAPSDAHHLRFAQLRALGRKVSDEFTVPLCRGHHREVHRTGNEPGFWDRAEIDALKIAHGLWQQSRRPADPTSKSAADLHN